jgi:leucyl-tRNA synthetase
MFNGLKEGISASYKFIQKLWALNEKVLEEINKDHSNDTNNELVVFTNKLIKKITDNLNNFSYNIIIANLHEM